MIFSIRARRKLIIIGSVSVMSQVPVLTALVKLMKERQANEKIPSMFLSLSVCCCPYLNLSLCFPAYLCLCLSSCVCLSLCPYLYLCLPLCFLLPFPFIQFMLPQHNQLNLTINTDAKLESLYVTFYSLLSLTLISTNILIHDSNLNSIYKFDFFSGIGSWTQTPAVCQNRKRGAIKVYTFFCT